MPTTPLPSPALPHSFPNAAHPTEGPGQTERQEGKETPLAGKSAANSCHALQLTVGPIPSCLGKTGNSFLVMEPQLAYDNFKECLLVSFCILPKCFPSIPWKRWAGVSFLYSDWGVHCLHVSNVMYDTQLNIAKQSKFHSQRLSSPRRGDSLETPSVREFGSDQEKGK